MKNSFAEHTASATSITSSTTSPQRNSFYSFWNNYVVDLKTLVNLCIESYKEVDNITADNAWYPLMQDTFAPMSGFIKTSYEKFKDKKHSKINFSSTLEKSAESQINLTDEDIECQDNNTLQKKVHMIAFCNPIDNQIVIVFRGTNFTLDVDDIFNDIQLAMQVCPNRVESAFNFVRKVEKLTSTWSFWKNHGLFNHCHWYRPTITLTGHSLGASVAEAVAHNFPYRTVTFESPGVPQRNRQLIRRNNIKSINSYPNIFNTVNPHAGQVFHIPTGTRSQRIEHVQRMFTDTLISAAQQGGKWTMDLIAGYFGLNSGLPINAIVDKVNHHIGEYLAFSRQHLEHVAKTHSLIAIQEYFQNHANNQLLEMQDWPTLEDILKKDPATEIERLDNLHLHQTVQQMRI